jgi:hypothetical protein
MYKFQIILYGDNIRFIGKSTEIVSLIKNYANFDI